MAGLKVKCDIRKRFHPTSHCAQSSIGKIPTTLFTIQSVKGVFVANGGGHHLFPTNSKVINVKVEEKYNAIFTVALARHLAP